MAARLRVVISTPQFPGYQPPQVSAESLPMPVKDMRVPTAFPCFLSFPCSLFFPSYTLDNKILPGHSDCFVLCFRTRREVKVNATVTRTYGNRCPCFSREVLIHWKLTFNLEVSHPELAFLELFIHWLFEIPNMAHSATRADIMHAKRSFVHIAQDPTLSLLLARMSPTGIAFAPV